MKYCAEILRKSGSSVAVLCGDRAVAILDGRLNLTNLIHDGQKMLLVSITGTVLVSKSEKEVGWMIPIR